MKKNYYRILLGYQNIYAKQAYDGNFIGTNARIYVDLTDCLSERKSFIETFYMHVLKTRPEKTKTMAVLRCGMLWMIAKGMKRGDIVLCPDDAEGKGNYYVGEIVGDYEYKNNEDLPHQRAVRWLPQRIAYTQMSDSLKDSCLWLDPWTEYVGDVSMYADEIEQLFSRSVVGLSIEKYFVEFLKKLKYIWATIAACSVR